MPRISEFYGIVIQMFHRDHLPPHFHATYGESAATIGIDPVQLIRGKLPPRQLAQVYEWAAVHQGELEQNWQRARSRDVLESIDPLA